MRMHVCWGNYEGPHHCDVPFADIVDLVFTARPNAIAFEAANPRHAHEWQIFEDVKLPDGKVLIPGVIESKANFIEHPELIAQRIRRYADLVGRENVHGRQRLRLRHLGRARPPSTPTWCGRSSPRSREGAATRLTCSCTEAFAASSFTTSGCGTRRSCAAAQSCCEVGTHS